MKFNLRHILTSLTFSLFILLCITTANAQTTSFTYQGKLTDSNVAATATYDMQFRLYDLPNAGQGTQLGATVVKPTVQATDGIFTTQLDFGAAVFAAGANVYLEISLRPAGNMGGYISLAPRQQITSAPYAIQSLNAMSAVQLNGVAGGQYIQTNDSRLSDNRSPTPGSGNYIQNGTAQQPASSFNISGNGNAGGLLSAPIVVATTQYNIGFSRVLSTAGTDNLFAGVGAGSANTTGSNNSFFGRSAGSANTSGAFNSFFGTNAGQANMTGGANSFFGHSAGSVNTGSLNSFFGTGAGERNTTGDQNAFFGKDAGFANTTGGSNSFFGNFAGYNNKEGDQNTFVGNGAGGLNTAGDFNAFFGRNDGAANTIGVNNTLIGTDANVAANNLNHATAIGAGALATSNNSVTLGRNVDTVRVPGNLVVTGTVSKGGGAFKIDHPLNPQNKTLSHSFVESPDMMNIYNGNAITNERGEATIALPDYFRALNRDFRYQLTVIGQLAQAFVAEEVKDNQFKIRSDKPNVKVSWQVTGIRQDKFANENRIPNTEDKPEAERGKCLYEPACQTKPIERKYLYK